MNASEQLPSEERKNLLTKLIDRYKDQPWADDAVQRAQQQLDDLEE